MPSTIVIGDIHGYYGRMVELLKQAELINADWSWRGGDTTVCFVGDYFDRGPDGISVVNLIIRLQREAEMAGGRVIALLGNHDVWILAARRFGQAPENSLQKAFMSSWLRYGGQVSDLKRLSPAHIDWVTQCPAMALLEDRLFIHADALFYAHYGDNIEQVNRAITTILTGNDAMAYDLLLGNFSDRFAFSEYDEYGVQRQDPAARARRFLSIFGGKQIVHGHTPICRMTGQEPEEVLTPHTYANNLCVNVDHGLYKGGPGFVYPLPSLP